MTDYTKTIRSFRGWTSMIDAIIANDVFRWFYIVDRDGATVARVFLNSADNGFITIGRSDDEKELGTKEMFKEIKVRCGSNFSIQPILNESGLFRVTC